MRAFLRNLWVVALLGVAACGVEEQGDGLGCADCSLLLISIDTLRADHLGSYGYARPTSPRIDRLAAEGILFELAYAPSYSTADSHMSMFTGVYPSVHRVRNTDDASHPARLSNGLQTLAEALAGAGFVNAGFHGGGNVASVYGFDRGFATYVAAPKTLDPAADWLRARRDHPEERFLLFAHTYRTHDPYLPDPPYNRLWLEEPGDLFFDAAQFDAAAPGGDFATRRALFWSRVDSQVPADVAGVVALYDGAIRQADDEVSRLLDAAATLPQRVLVVLVSDHGEEFFEHGRSLHEELFEETLHVPFVVRFPDGRAASRRVPWRVSLVDLAPTLLDILGVEGLPIAQGRSLIPELARERSSRRPIIAEKLVGKVPKGRLTRKSLKQAVWSDAWKLIAWREETRKLFDLANDPGEARDAITRAPLEAQRLDSMLEGRNELNHKLWSRVPKGESLGPLDAETVEQLRALGYLQ